MRSRIPLVAALAVLVALAIAWLFWPRAPTDFELVPPPDEPFPTPAAHGADLPDEAQMHRPEPSASARPLRELETDKRAARDELRAKILAAEAAKRSLKRAPPPRPSSAAPASEDPGAEAGELKDRIGGRDALLAELNRDFMPLASECIEQARQRSPQLQGMLGLALETVADEDLGAIVESVEAPPANEIVDPELLECIQATALTLMLPPPPAGGREQFMITIPIEPEAE